MSLAIVAKLSVAPDKAQAFEQAFQEMAQLVQAEEPGCLLYALCRDEKTPGIYWVMEQYRDQEARDAHGRSEGFRNAAQKLGPFMAGNMEMHLCAVCENAGFNRG